MVFHVSPACWHLAPYCYVLDCPKDIFAEPAPGVLADVVDPTAEILLTKVGKKSEMIKFLCTHLRYCCLHFLLLILLTFRRKLFLYLL